MTNPLCVLCKNSYVYNDIIQCVQWEFQVSMRLLTLKTVSFRLMSRSSSSSLTSMEVFCPDSPFFADETNFFVASRQHMTDP